MNLPKCLRPYADLIDAVTDERQYDQGYFVYLAPGWWSPEDGMHCVHANTLSACAMKMKRVQRCQRICCGEGQPYGA
jgi:hypothetical protein